MSDQAQTEAPQLTDAERMDALENQLYVIYLQLNAATKLLLDKGVITHDEMTKEMDVLNKEIFKLTADVMDKVKAEGAEAATEEVVEEAPAAE